MSNAAPKPMPYTVAVDTREQLPYEFARPLRIGAAYFSFATSRATLSAGDYSIVGLEAEIAIERKSLSDAFGTFGKGRERFERELARLSVYKFAAVVIEAEWSTIFAAPKMPSFRAKLHPRSILGSIIAWQVRFPTIQWCLLPDRNAAEGYTARLLDRFYRESEARRDCANVQLPLSQPDAALPAVLGNDGLPHKPIDWGSGVPPD